MFRPTDRQRSLFEVDQQMTPSQRRRLEKSWAWPFHERVLPLLLEQERTLAGLYDEETGRPNWSAARMLGLLLIQEMEDLSDQKVLDGLTFDARFQYALGLPAEEAYLSRRSLCDFRARLADRDPQGELVRGVHLRVVDAAADALKISTKEQRIDSTLVSSNIVTHGRSDLFRKTLMHFLKWLSKTYPEREAGLRRTTRKWYRKTEEDGWFGRGDKATAQKRIKAMAGLLQDVVQTFEDDAQVNAEEPYQLVVRVFREHCEVRQGGGSDGGDSGAGGSSKEDEIEVRKKPEKPGSSLQSPYDPDAGYNHKKGPGYLAQITETCGNDGTEIITDYDVTPANVSDHGQDLKSLDRLERAGRKPEVLYADGGYPSGSSLMAATEMGVELVAPVVLPRMPPDTVGRDRFVMDEKTGDMVTCPRGHAATRHGMRMAFDGSAATRHAFFDAKTCRACDLHGRCVVRSATKNGRKKGSCFVDVRPELVTRDRAWARQQEDEWWDRYAIRSGIEATASELKRRHGLGKLRVRRMPKVRMAVGLKVTACNVKRFMRALLAAEAVPQAA